MTDAWRQGENLTLRELWAEVEVSGSRVRQLVRPSTQAVVAAADSTNGIVAVDDNEIPVFLKNRTGIDEPYLVAPIGASALESTDLARLKWVNRPVPTSPAAVLEQLAGRFRLVEESATSAGFRQPQVGAIHSVLGYWTTDPDRVATVVMPTGTGKTDTMVGLFAASTPSRLLILVPSDALRHQIAEKFESLGVLPNVGAIATDDLLYPVVGRLEKTLKTAADARKFARKCNVVIATPHVISSSKEPARTALLDEFSHLFVDEAHHVRATTWEAIRTSFATKRVVQFTATPYREDGRELGGRMIYVFPLRLAQELEYFSTIQYRGIRSMSKADSHIARAAIAQLREDLAAGLDHVIMARVKTKSRADQVAAIYKQLAADLGPLALYSGMTPASDRRKALDGLKDRSCRIVVCVDMLGEGFDLPSLKIAAIHDPHKSLAVTLQFIGRFARVASHVGDATVVVGRPDAIGDETLRALYAEDPDWNLIIRDLSEQATSSEEEASEFDDGFQNVPVGAATHQLRPKLSAVVYRTSCNDWSPDEVVSFFGSERVLTQPIPNNPATNVAWFIVRGQSFSPWGPDPGYLNVGHELYVMFWDRSNGLLYINSSNNDSADKHHQKLAEVVAGATATRIRGDDVFRTFGGVDRPIPTNVGLLDIRSRARKHAQYAGANVNEGFPTGEKGTKTQTNIFAHGYRDGSRVQLGASLKGRVWARREAGNVLDWVNWCRSTGARLTDSTINIDEVLANFIRPDLLDDRPPLIVLAAEWPAHAYTSLTGNARARLNGVETALIDTELRVTEFATAGPIKIELVADGWAAPYEISITDQGLRANATSNAKVDIVTSSKEVAFEDYVATKGLTLICEGEAVIEPPGVLYRPDREKPAFPRTSLRTHVSWNGVDLKVESQGKQRRTDSIQRRVIETMIAAGSNWCDPSASASAPWEVIIDDDGANELADVVGLRREHGHLYIDLVHCKFSRDSKPGARVGDLYEVCGQAQKSVARRRDLEQLFPHLLRREKRRQSKGHSGFEAGDAEMLYEMENELRQLRLSLRIVVVQPGLAAQKASKAQLDLLGATEMFVLEVGGAEFEVVTSP